MQPMDWAVLPFKRYFDFSGRSPRAEYWYFAALMLFISLILELAVLTLGETAALPVAVVNFIIALATFIPSLSVAVRRLHDINRSGFVILKYLIAMIAASLLLALYAVLGTAAIVVSALLIIALSTKFIILMVSEGDRGPNPYGPNPYGLNYGY